MSAILEVEGLAKSYLLKRGWRRSPRVVRAVQDVDLALQDGRTLALVGESGSGKSTLARLVVRLEEPDRGRIRFRGEDLLRFRGEALRRRRRDLQMVFQATRGALNPRLTAGESIAESLRAHGLVPGNREARVEELLERVGLDPRLRRRRPARLSGGERQRVGIARALATEPRLIVADEPVSALDVSVQAQILNLFARLQDELGLSLLFIAHDLAVVEQIAHRIAVMYQGRIVEEASTRDLVARPLHPYTVGLLEAVPDPRPGRRQDLGSVPPDPRGPAEPSRGCPFQTRCPSARERCSAERPVLVEVEPGHRVACHFPGEAGSGNISPTPA